jgi:hypothetical protein
MITTNQRHYGNKRKHIIFVDGTKPDLPVPPYGQKGENADNDRDWRIYNREEVRLMKEAASLATCLPVTAFTFSRKAGCSCPCSPGLLMEPLSDYPSGYATWVTVTEDAS